MPPPEKVVSYSRVALGLTVGLALIMAVVSDNILGYISNIINLFMTGMCVCGILGRVWPRYNAAGALASLIGAFVTALVFKEWNTIWGNPVIPSLAISSLAGILVSCITPPDKKTHDEALNQLQQEREEMQTD